MHRPGARSLFIWGAEGAVVTADFRSLCRVTELADPGAREFELQLEAATISGFILHWRGGWYAYRNRCPHTGVSLNWLPDQFYDVAFEFVQCSLHGALFRPQDGLCIYGPCVGRSLEPLPVIMRGAEVGICPGEIAVG